MKKTQLFTRLFICVLLTGFLTACSSNSPGQITMSIWNQMKKGNFEKAINIWFDNADDSSMGQAESMTGGDKKEMIKALAEKAKQGADKKGGIKDVEMVDESIAEDGNSATVTVKIIYNDESTDTDITKFIKKDGTWKIDASSK